MNVIARNLLCISYLCLGTLPFSLPLQLRAEPAPENNTVLQSKSKDVSEKIDLIVKDLEINAEKFDPPSGFSLFEEGVQISQPTSEILKELSLPVQLDTQEGSIELSLEDATLIALKNNLDNKALKYEAKRSQALMYSAFSNLLPDLNFSYSYIYRDGASFVSPTTGVPIGSRQNFIAQGALVASASVDTILNSAAAYYDWKASVNDKKAGSQEVLRKVANLYHNLLRARAELKIREEALKQAKQQLDINEKLSRGGMGTKFAEIQSQQQIAEFETELLNQQGVSRFAELDLLFELNVPLDTQLILSDSQIVQKPLLTKETSIESLVKTGQKNRPDVTSKRIALKASQMRIKESFAHFLPSVSVSASSIGNKTNMGASLDPNRQDDFQNFVTEINWRPLDGLGLGQISDISRRNAEEKLAIIELKKLLLNIDKEVRQAFVTSNVANEQISSAQKQLDAAIEGITLSRKRFSNGIGTNLDIIESQRNYVNALINKVRAITLYNQSQVDLLKATGTLSASKLASPHQNVQ